MPVIQIHFVDTFTTNCNAAFTGNPAAVCFLNYDDEISDEVKQKIASELNLTITCFVSSGWTKDQKLSDPLSRTIRWFTVTNEVPLCGHATVASAKAISESQLGNVYLHKPDLENLTINFESKARGKLGAVVSRDSGRITLNFPSNPTHKLEKADHVWMDEMIEATLGKEFSTESVADVQYSPLTKILLLRLSDKFTPEDLRKKVSPDFSRQVSINTGDFVKDIIVTVKGTDGDVSKGNPHFYSRFFAPWDGVDEDPVTGCAHTVLTPYWTEAYSRSGSKEVGTMLAEQLSSRGGRMYCTLKGDRVNLAGEARLLIKGQLFV